MMQAWVERLRCPACGARVSDGGESLRCTACSEVYPVVDGIPRMLTSSTRAALGGEGTALDPRQVATAESFGFEWHRFSQMYAEWEPSFLEYVAPHRADFFPGKRVLDAGCGSGRHAHWAGRYGAEVWAADLGPAVEVARKNTAELANVQVVQADLHRLPFPEESFDYVYSFGVLHHLPEPEAAFRGLLRYVKPGGEVQIYLYWHPEGQPVKRALLAGVSAAREVTRRLPHPLLYALSYPAAAVAWAGFVWPYRALKAMGARAAAESLPMKQYAAYPFRVCVNDQFDRFSAPIENRYTRAEVLSWLERAGLEEPSVHPNYGWIARGRKPVPAPEVAHGR
jgi:SAM-dependent methyltransferase/uncharacterized protein YbaR (Trm112 family)